MQVVVGTWHIAQPAMIYLVPGTLVHMVTILSLSPSHTHIPSLTHTLTLTLSFTHTPTLSPSRL